MLEKELSRKIPDFGEDPGQSNILPDYLSSGNNLNSLEDEDIDKIKEMIGDSISEINEKINDELTSDSDKVGLQDILGILEKQEESPDFNVQKKDFYGQKIVVNLLIENHSKSRNWVHKIGAIRFHKNREDERLVIVNLKQESNDDATQNQSEYVLIDGNGLKPLKFESKILEKLEKDKHFLKSAFDNEYNYIVAVEDVKGRVWHAEGTVVGYDRDYHSKNLEDKTTRILNEKYGSLIPWK